MNTTPHKQRQTTINNTLWRRMPARASLASRSCSTCIAIGEDSRSNGGSRGGGLLQSANPDYSTKRNPSDAQVGKPPNI